MKTKSQIYLTFMFFQYDKSSSFQIDSSVFLVNPYIQILWFEISR